MSDSEEEYPTHLEDGGLKFPPSSRVDIQLPDSLDISNQLGKARMYSDIDCMYMISRNFGNLVDAVTSPSCVYTFASNVKRYKSNKSSRFRFDMTRMGGVGVPRFDGKTQTKVFPAEWFPNIELCTIDQASGIRTHVIFYLLGCEAVRKCNYFTKMELSVIVSALNYARTNWRFMSSLCEVLEDHDQDQNFAQYMGDFQAFEGQVNAKDEQPGRKSTNENMPSTFGRMFLKFFFEALRLYAEDMETARHPNPQNPDYVVEVNSQFFLNMTDYKISLEDMSKTAALMYKKGVVVGQAVGIKKCIEQLPELETFLQDKEKVDGFILNSFNFMRHQVGRFVDPCFVDPEDRERLESDSDEDGNNNDEQKNDDGSDRSDTTHIHRHPNLKKNHGHFKLPRDTADVHIFYDVGFNFTPSDPNTSFGSNGIEACWLSNVIMSKYRTDPAQFRSQEFLLKGFEGIGDGPVRAALHHKLLELIATQDDESDEDELPPELQYETPAHYYERELMDFIQTKFDLPGDLEDTDQIDLDEVMRVLSRSKQTLYPQYGTNGALGNVHSGKIHIGVSFTNDGTGSLTLMAPVMHEEDGFVLVSNICGMQIYMPSSRTRSLTRVRTKLSELMKFPSYLMLLLSQQDDGPKTFDYEKVRKEVGRLFEGLINHEKQQLFEEEYVIQQGVRFEFFIQYDPTHDFTHENLDQLPNIATPLRQYRQADVREYLETLFNNASMPLACLLAMDSQHRADQNHTDLFTLSPAVKTAYCALAELMVAYKDMHPFIGRIIKRCLRERDHKDQLGPWDIPTACRVELDDATKALTGLLYGVEPHYLSIAADMRVLPRDDFYKRGGIRSDVQAMAMIIRNRVRIPLQFHEAMNKIRALFLIYSNAPTQREANFTDDEMDESLAYEVEVPIFTTIDYESLAQLDVSRRENMTRSITRIMADLYDCNYYDLLVHTKRKTDHGNDPQGYPKDSMTINQFPKTKFGLSEMVYEYSNDEVHVLSNFGLVADNARNEGAPKRLKTLGEFREKNMV
jgi:hypothetical protein